MAENKEEKKLNPDEEADLQEGSKGKTDLVREIDRKVIVASAKVEEWNKEAKEDFNFALGEQWTAEEKTKLEDQGRPVLTFNKIEPLIDLVCGHHTENKARIKAHPEGGEDKLFSEVADKAINHVDKMGHLNFKEDICFEEGAICGKSYLELGQVYDKDPINGDLVFRNDEPYAILVDPDSKEYDLSDARYLIKLTKLSKSRLIELYPKKESIIKTFNISMDDSTGDVKKEGDADNYHLGKEEEVNDKTATEDTLAGKDQLFTLKEYWHRKSVEKWFIYNIHEDIVEKFNTKEEAEAKKAEILKIFKDQFESATRKYQENLLKAPQMAPDMGMGGTGGMGGSMPMIDPTFIPNMPQPVDDTPADLKVFNRNVDEMWYASTACGYELQEDVRSPFSPSYEGFPIFRFLAKWRPSAQTEVLKIKGIVRNLKDPNREINKSRSQFLHILNTQAHSGWIGDDDALPDDNAWKDLKEMGSRPGVVIRKKKGTELREIEPKGASYANQLRGEKAEQDIKEISGINSDALAIQDKTTSGRAIALRIKQAVMILARMFKNFRFTKELMGTAIFNMLPTIFDAKKLAKVLGEKFMATNQIDLGYLKAFLTQVEDGKYNLSVSEGDSSATIRLEVFEQLMEMASNGMPIPPDLIIEFSSMPNSKEILDRIRQYAEQAQANARPAGK